MNTLRLPIATLSALALVTAVAPRATAEEGGAGHHVPGGKSTLIDLLPSKPGWVFETMYLHYDGDAAAGVNLPVAGLLSLNLDATSDALTVGGIYTFEPQVLGAYFSVGAFLPYVWTDVNARVSLNNTTVRSSSSVNGIGDLSLMPIMMAWNLNCWQIDLALPIYAPTGDYEVGRLANQGLNHWTFDPTIGAGYANEQTGFNFAAHTGFAFSTENNDTNYRNGTMFHIDASIQQLLPLGPGFIGLGIEGFYVDQITGDSGSGATLGDFEGRTAGLGPVLSYILPVGENTLVAEARWLTELDTKRRMEGDYFWLKIVYQF